MTEQKQYLRNQLDWLNRKPELNEMEQRAKNQIMNELSQPLDGEEVDV